MSKSPKVCIIGPAVDTNYIGGVATHIRNLKTLLCFRDAVVLDPGSLNSNAKTDFFMIAKNVIAMRNKIITGNFSHVLVNTSIYTSAFIKLLVILAIIPAKDREIHVFFHGGRFPVFNNTFCKIINLLCRPIMAKVKKFHFLSTVQLDGFHKLFADCETALYANYSTADTIWQKSAISDANSLKLLFVGRLVKEKGIFELLAAIEKVSAEKKNVKLTIAGDGPELPDLIKLSEKLPPDTIHFTGYLTGTALEEVYQNADILALPTYHPEGFPYVVIEAMRAGLPIISTSSGALETLVQDGTTGFKVKTKDIDSIVWAIDKLSGDSALLADMSNNCYRYFEENLSQSAAENFYSRLLDVKPIEHGVNGDAAAR
jgi:glycosyltransferase involved in cell wall biosynthesis